ncbi:MAG: acyclic terpene utilization AtuA family protein [Pseudomonadota bacterium]
MTRVLIPTGALGISFSHEALMVGIANKPDIIAVDGGSTDSGPFYLGEGVSKYSGSSVKAEWRQLVRAREAAGVPLVVGTAGTCGSDSAVDWLFDITREIAAEEGLSLKVALLYSGQSADSIAQALEDGRVQALPGAPVADAGVIRACTNIVALAGAEQIQAAIGTGADIIIAGRTTDTATIAALPLMRGDHIGAAWHGAKVGECGALATSQPSTGVVQIDFDATGFTLTPMAGAARATPYSVSAHMLYENSDPFTLYEPGGCLDVSRAVYTQLDDRSVRVEGADWQPGRYTVKLEGARLAGYQAVSMALLRERRYVRKAREWADAIRTECLSKVSGSLGIDAGSFDIEMRLIGVDAVLGDLETEESTVHEVGVMAITTASSEAHAREIAKLLNPYLLHHALTRDEPMPTFAFPFSPAEVMRGPLYEFCLHHVLELEDPMAVFRLETKEL